MADAQLELFDAALVRFLNERAASCTEPTWDVKADGEDEWEIALWLNGEWGGLWRVTVAGSEKLNEWAWGWRN